MKRALSRRKMRRTRLRTRLSRTTASTTRTTSKSSLSNSSKTGMGTSMCRSIRIVMGRMRRRRWSWRPLPRYSLTLTPIKTHLEDSFWYRSIILKRGMRLKWFTPGTDWENHRAIRNKGRSSSIRWISSSSRTKVGHKIRKLTNNNRKDFSNRKTIWMTNTNRSLWSLNNKRSNSSINKCSLEVQSKLTVRRKTKRMKMVSSKPSRRKTEEH